MLVLIKIRLLTVNGSKVLRFQKGSSAVTDSVYTGAALQGEGERNKPRQEHRWVSLQMCLSHLRGLLVPLKWTQQHLMRSLVLETCLYSSTGHKSSTPFKGSYALNGAMRHENVQNPRPFTHQRAASQHQVTFKVLLKVVEPSVRPLLLSFHSFTSTHRLMLLLRWQNSTNRSGSQFTQQCTRTHTPAHTHTQPVEHLTD